MNYNKPQQDWRGKTVWAIGASSGIGRATASALHARGAKVTVSARNTAALVQFEQEHPGSLGLPLDVGDRAAVESAAQTVWGRQPLDWMVYSAGHYQPQTAQTLNLDELLLHQQINYAGALHVLAATVPHMLRQRTGHISLLGSVAGYRGLPNSLAYGPTKAAINHLAEILYLDLHPAGVGVSLVCPGFVQTQLTDKNHFAMPALISPEMAAQNILRGWAQGAFEIHFPKRFTYSMKLLRLLPHWLAFALLRRIAM